MTKEASKTVKENSFISGFELRSMRKSLGMSQKDLAIELDMNRSTIWSMEAGDDIIQKRTVLAVRYLLLSKAMKILDNINANQPE